MLRRQIGRVSMALVLLGVIGLLLLAGVGLVLAAVYHWLTPIWGTAGGFAAVGGLCLLVAGVLAGWSYRWLR